MDYYYYMLLLIHATMYYTHMHAHMYIHTHSYILRTNFYVLPLVHNCTHHSCILLWMIYWTCSTTQLMWYTHCAIPLFWSPFPTEALDPGEVQLTLTDIGDGVLTWSRSVSGDELEHITIQRRVHTNSLEESEHGWVDVTSRAPVEGHSYPFRDKRVGQFDYRVRLHVKGMSSDWVFAQKCLNNYSKLVSWPSQLEGKCVNLVEYV